MKAERHILIVEDEPVLAKNLARFLARRGFAVKTTRSALSAVYELKQSVIDALLLDIDLPDRDGLELCRHVRLVSPKVRIIMMSGRCLSEQQIRTQELQLCAFLAKPFPLPELARVLTDTNGSRNLSSERRG